MPEQTMFLHAPHAMDLNTFEYLPTPVYKTLTPALPKYREGDINWHHGNTLFQKAVVAHTTPLGERQTLNEKLYANVCTVYANG